ncbi:uncharacterized protein LOC112200165 [Rosa chinensis]|uniref:uncharacterized protein LOC112200165 n=1 Tax=Rosa chinensis TaxID=74649 RepID=UPI000D093F1C|nr:uncharacterized protein LOC112200165 [Rosa chinensis]
MDYDLLEEGIEAFRSIHERLSSYMVEKEAYDRIATLEVVNEELSDPEDEDEVNVQLAPAALDDTPPKVKDPIEKVNLGTVDEPMEVSISAYLEPSEKQRLIDLLQEFKDCFVEKYEDMPGLSPDLVCHQLPTLSDKRPVKQEPRRMNSETQILVKEEVEKMHKSGIIRVAKYNQWLSNIVPVRKKNGYHQIPVAEEDRHKTAFRCPGFTGVFEYVVMPFGLKNAGATYQRAMNLIFHDILGKVLEVYIDDVVVKSQKRGDHIVDLRKVFERMRRHRLKMNPAKYVFGVQAGDFLGFIVHQRGIEVPEDKASAVINASPPRTKKELQRLLGKINFLRRFISNSAGKIQPFSPLLRLQGQNEFVWEPKHQEAFDSIKAYLANPPVLVPPRTGIPLKLYISAAEASIGSLLAQDDEGGVEHAIFYLSRTLTDCETRYTPMEKLCLTLYFSACKLRHYMLSFTTCIIAQTDLAEYEALIIGLEVLLEMGIRDVQIRGNSQLVINQIQEKYRCASWLLIPYLNRAIELLDQFTDVDMEYIPRERNFAANELAQLATGITLKYGVRERILKVERRTLPSWFARPDPPDDPVIAVLEPIDVDWRIPLVEYLKHPGPSADRRMRFLALNYFLRGDELRRRGEDGVDFRCVYGREAKRLMRKVYTGICGSHQAGPKMRWLLRRHGYYWPSILKDCIAFAKGCEDCQHKFIIVATDYFTKWVEAEPLNGASGATIRQFIFRNILCRFGIPEVLVSDRGAAFMGGPVEELVNDFGIQFIHSTPYYAQSNGQAEASNKTIITLLKKMLVENPRQWHDTLYETLWAYRTSKRNPTATTPYALMFGHDAVLPLEINVHSLRVQEQHHLIGEDYVQSILPLYTQILLLSRRRCHQYRRKRERRDPSYPFLEPFLRAGVRVRSRRDSQPHLPPGVNQKVRTQAPEVDRGGRTVNLEEAFLPSSTRSSRAV